MDVRAATFSQRELCQITGLDTVTVDTWLIRGILETTKVDGRVLRGRRLFSVLTIFEAVNCPATGCRPGPARNHMITHRGALPQELAGGVPDNTQTRRNRLHLAQDSFCCLCLPTNRPKPKRPMDGHF